MKTQQICKSCGTRFSLTERQVDFYVENDWSLPTHCVACRKNNREERCSPYFGLAEAMTNWASTKKRRQRVHYAPHIVGGYQ